MEQVFDHTIAVVADEELRRERAGSARHTRAGERTARQLTQTGKSRASGVRGRNDGDLAELERKLSALLENIKP